MNGRPLPAIDPRSEGYWEAARAGKLCVAACGACGGFSFPPPLVCPHCQLPMPGVHWQEVTGRGHVRSWTVVRQSFLPGFEVPYVVVDVELDGTDGLRMVGRLLGSDDGLALDASVLVAFEQVDDIAVPGFQLEAAG